MSNIIRWNPWDAVGMLDQMLSHTSPSVRSFIPNTDVQETDQSYLFHLDVPGVQEGDLTIMIENNTLFIRGERKAERIESGKGFQRVERSFGSWNRHFSLPQGIDPEAITAQLDNGVLQVTVPKPEQVRPQSVRIEVGSSAKDTTVNGTTSTKELSSSDTTDKGSDTTSTTDEYATAS